MQGYEQIRKREFWIEEIKAHMKRKNLPLTFTD